MNRTIILLLFAVLPAAAQFTVTGDFRVRWYSDSYDDALDSRGKENYMRYLGRLRGVTSLGENTLFRTELITLIDNPNAPVRNIAGTGAMRYGITQIYAEMTYPDLLVFDVVRFRLGRQQFPIGNGLSMGDSYYFLDKFDGARIDLMVAPFTLSLFGAITGQNLSGTGLYPDPGSDQLYVARLGTTVWKQSVMAYLINQKLRGSFNDTYVAGAGATGEIVYKDLEYNIEGAYQSYHTVPGLPGKHGLGYMGGVSYRWGMGPFRSIKVESRYAAYEGDDASTREIEMFSPPYPSFWWGSRAGYVDGDVGGDFPRNGRNLEGSRIWYSRVYVIPSALPKLRVQAQYIHVGEYVDNDDYNTMDDELSVRAYYTLSAQSALQVRYARAFPNDGDRDLNGDGRISSTEDRYSVSSIMLEWQVQF
ncbi:MAG: hypothetical protein F9K22_08675 [Bacteroidetes bacterium]|nr:MAG: hypothetical protein F9K22_08675 [Bacteroidota bacterium]